MLNIRLVFLWNCSYKKKSVTFKQFPFLSFNVIITYHTEKQIIHSILINLYLAIVCKKKNCSIWFYLYSYYTNKRIRLYIVILIMTQLVLRRFGNCFGKGFARKSYDNIKSAVKSWNIKQSRLSKITKYTIAVTGDSRTISSCLLFS